MLVRLSRDKGQRSARERVHLHQDAGDRRVLDLTAEVVLLVWYGQRQVSLMQETS